jgi:TonB family protein
MDTIRGKIRVSVRVKVDGAGNVTDAELESPGSSRYFARLSMEAAQGWKFAPAQSNEERAARSWRLQFEFTNTGTRAIPERAAT